MQISWGREPSPLIKWLVWNPERAMVCTTGHRLAEEIKIFPAHISAVLTFRFPSNITKIGRGRGERGKNCLRWLDWVLSGVLICHFLPLFKDFGVLIHRFNIIWNCFVSYFFVSYSRRGNLRSGGLNVTLQATPPPQPWAFLPGWNASMKSDHSSSMPG